MESIYTPIDNANAVTIQDQKMFTRLVAHPNGTYLLLDPLLIDANLMLIALR